MINKCYNIKGDNMEILNYIKEKTLLIVPNYYKKKILLNIHNLNNVKFMTLEEFKYNYYFSYDEKTIYYLVDKYHYKYDIAKMYLDNLYYINEEVKDEKIKFLISLKKELDENKLLYYNPLFKNYLKNTNIIISNYFLTLFDKKMFKNINTSVKIIEQEIIEKDLEIYEFNNIDREITFVATKIVELLNNNVNIKNIKLCNVTEEYYNPIKRIFDFYNIPVKIKDESLYSINDTLIFLKNIKNNIDKDDALKEIKNDELKISIINILNKYSFSDVNETLITCLENELKNKKINFSNNSNVIECIDIESISFDKNTYTFLLGVNQGSFPRIYKNENYLDDNLCKLLKIDDSINKNKLEKEKCKYIIYNLDNLVMTYKLTTPYESYLKSPLIDDENIKVINNFEIPNEYNYSNIYNKIELSKKIDNLIKYNEKDNNLNYLYNNYKNINYNSYDNKFTGIDNNDLKEYLNNKLLLSYSSVDNYYRCGFRYYINNLLKLDKYEETFAIFIGNLFHEILSIAFLDNFNFELEFNNYVEKKKDNFNNKELFFIEKLKKDLLFIIDTIKEQNKYSKYTDELYEEKVYINNDGNTKITFMGIVDKIKYLKEEDKTYVAIIDYKTGTPITNLTYTNYGINMQLPIYLYLVKNTNKLKNVEVTGFYLQKIINSEVKASSSDEYIQKRKEKLKLEGYSVSNEETLEKFDITYKDSELIKSMKITKSGFSTYSKILSSKQIDNLYKIVSEKIKEAGYNILGGKFSVNPKKIGKNLVGCEYCKYHDLCYKKENDVVYLKEYHDLSFLEGEIDAKLD